MRDADIDRLLDKEVLRVGEASRLLGVHRMTLIRWTNRGLLKCWVLPNGERRFATQAILRMRGQLEDSVPQDISAKHEVLTAS